MKPIVIGVTIVTLFGGAFYWFSREQPPPAPPPAKSTQVENPEVIERRRLFGAESLVPGVQWRSRGLGLLVSDEGKPPKPGIGARVRVLYTGRTKDGTVFDRADKPREFLIGGTIPGMSVALQALGTGGKATVFIPPALGYGGVKVMGIPPSSGLIFDLNVVSIDP